MVHAFVSVALSQPFSDQFRFFDVDHALSSVVFSLLDERDWVFVRVRFVERFRRGGRERRGFTGECFCCLWHSFVVIVVVLCFDALVVVRFHSVHKILLITIIVIIHHQ